MRGFVFFALAGVPLVAFLAYWQWKKEQQRRELLLQWCLSNGFELTVEDDTWCERWSGPPFDTGDHRRARNVVSGRSGEWPFVAFDYSYQTHSTDSQGRTTTTTHRYVVTSLQLPAYLPRLQVTPENLFTRFGNALGLDDIELESEDFNRRFRVHAADRKFASDVLSPRTMEFLLTRPGLSFRIEGADILAWDDGELRPAVAVNTTGVLKRIVTGIPSFVWKDHS